MKKTFSKIIAAFLVVMMAVAMIPSAFAADATDGKTWDTTTNRTITVSNNYVTGDEGKTIDSSKLNFVVYKVADITQSASNPIKLNYTAVDGATFSKAPSAESVAADVTIDTSKLTPIEGTRTGDNFNFNLGTDNGLYVIRCTAKPTNVQSVTDVLVQVPNMYNWNAETKTYDKTTDWNYSAQAFPKAVFQTTDLDKYIKLANGDKVAETVATGAKGERVGDTVTFELDTKVVGTKADPLKTFVAKDVMSAGLTYTAGSFKVMATPVAGGDDVNITDKVALNGPTAVTGGNSLDFDFAAMIVDATLYDYTNISITYDAVVNENAVMGEAGNPNKAHLEYNNDTDTTETPEKVVKVYTYGLEILKVDATTKTPLAGATFVIKNAEGVVLDTQTSDDNGKLSFDRLATGTYTVTETVAPDGYQLLKDAVTVTITKDNVTTDGKYQITVEDPKFVTPVTGGIGSIIFVVAGVTIMGVGAFLFFKSRKKKESK